jgi:hypothetical protein
MIMKKLKFRKKYERIDMTYGLVVRASSYCGDCGRKLS